MRVARALAALAAVAAVPIGAQPGRCTAIVGYNDMAAIIAAAVARLKVSHPALCYTVSLPSTRAGPPALMAGTADLAPMGAAMSPADRAAFRARWGGEPVAFRIAHDSLAPAALSSPTGVLVAASNPLRAITMPAVRRVFTESAAPVWGDLGATGAWAAKPIHRVALAADTAIGQYLLNGPLRAERFSAGVTPARQSRDVAAAVAADPLALGLANLNGARDTVRALPIRDDGARLRRPDAATIRAGLWPLDRFLLIYARPRRAGGMTAGARALLDLLLSDEGQAIVGAPPLAYLPLNSRERRVERRALDR